MKFKIKYHYEARNLSTTIESKNIKTARAKFFRYHSKKCKIEKIEPINNKK